ncbi:MAG: hypothetical protein A2X49_10080 [Lentisphaerae bacterium GWF2_52_8]|nr:MAG: hypothetical protein A2X49_10080 [Lentisphaerae bacterium GWF2_52_8]
MRLSFLFSALFVSASLSFQAASLAGDTEGGIALPKPQTEGGIPLMQALKARHSARTFSPDTLPLQTVSNLLWAASGITREDGKRTAPSACNWQEIDIYLAMPQGLYLYDAKEHKLIKTLPDDIRATTGKQPFVKNAPLCLIYVADFKKMGDAPENDKAFYSATDTGFVSQNVYLFCASAGLNTVVLGFVDKPALAAAMKLRPEQKIILSQPVGAPAKD